MRHAREANELLRDLRRVKALKVTRKPLRAKNRKRKRAALAVPSVRLAAGDTNDGHRAAYKGQILKRCRRDGAVRVPKPISI